MDDQPPFPQDVTSTMPVQQPGLKKPQTLDLECPKCGGGTSVNFKNGKPYDYCPECGWSNRLAALGHNQGRPAGVADDEPNPYNH